MVITNLMSEHGSMSSASHNVLLVKQLIEMSRFSEAFNGFRYALLEPSSPKFSFFGLELGLVLGLGFHSGLDPVRGECTGVWSYAARGEGGGEGTWWSKG